MDLREKRSSFFEAADWILRMRWPLLVLFSIPLWLTFKEHFYLLDLFFEETRLQHGFMLQYLVLGEGSLQWKLIKIAESGVFIFVQFPLIFLMRSYKNHKWIWIGIPLIFLTQWQILVLKPPFFSNAILLLFALSVFTFLLFLAFKWAWAGIWLPIILLTITWWVQVQGFTQMLGIHQLAENIWVLQWFSVFLVCDLLSFAFSFLGYLKAGKPKLASLSYTIGADLKWTIIIWTGMVLGGLIFFQSGTISAKALFLALIMFSFTHVCYRMIIFPSLLSIFPFKIIDKK